MASILDKYTNTIVELEKMTSKISVLQEITKQKLKEEQTTQGKDDILKAFVQNVDKMRSDFKDRYNKLKERRKDLYSKLCDMLCDKSNNKFNNEINNDEIDNVINDLLEKYKI